MNSYGFNGTVPAWAVAEYDYINGEITGKFYTEQEAGTYKESFIDGQIHLGLEPVNK
jgi:hypothetical protein